MPYLNCPECRLSLYSPPHVLPRERCPRCRARLGRAAPALFATDLPARFMDPVRQGERDLARENPEPTDR